MTTLGDSYKIIYDNDRHGKEAIYMINDIGFWNELDEMLSLVKLVKMRIQEIEIERPLVG